MYEYDTTTMITTLSNRVSARASEPLEYNLGLSVCRPVARW